MKQQKIQATFIMAFKNTDTSREEIFFFMLEYLKYYFPKSEVIVVENDNYQNIPDISKYRNEYDIKYFFIRNPSPANLFNKSICMNKGYKEATYTDKLVFLDFDMFLKPSDITNALMELSNSTIVSPYTTQMIDLNEEDTDYIINNFESMSSEEFDVIDNQVLRENHVLCGGIFMTTKASMDKIKGYPEEIFGWGCEDNIVSIKFNKVLGNIKLLNKKVYHLHHKPGAKNMDLMKLKYEIMYFFNRLPTEEYIRSNCDFKKLLDKNRKLKNSYKYYIEEMGYSF